MVKDLREKPRTEKFRIGELFDIHPTCTYKLTNSELYALAGETPVLSNSERNNGIAGYCGLKPTESGGIITFSDTASGADTMFYQPRPFIGYPHVQGMYPYQEGVWDEASCLYAISCARRSSGDIYSYATKYKRTIVRDIQIELPIVESADPGHVYTPEDIDWAYMRKYIAELEAERIAELEAYLKATGLESCELNEEDKEILALHKARVGFKEFRIGDLFDIINNPQLDKDTFVFNDKAKYPYFTRTENNNGILGYVEYLDDAHKIPGNSLASGMITMRFHYMSHDFYAGQFTKTLIPKFNGFNETIALYFVSILNKHSERYQSELVRHFSDMVMETIVELPSTTSGAPDFAFMGKYITAIEKQTIANVVRYKDKAIDTAKALVQKA